MRYAEIRRRGDQFPRLVRFETMAERDSAAASFDGLWFIDLTYAQARKLYDLRRFGRPRYVTPITMDGHEWDSIMRTDDQRQHEFSLVSEVESRESDESDVFGLRKLLEIFEGRE